MSVTNKIEVTWEFDIETNEELQSRLGLTEGEVAEMVADEHDAVTLHTLCCNELSIPFFVNLDLFFDNPHDVSNEHITDVMSEEYGWDIKEWHYVQRC